MAADRAVGSMRLLIILIASAGFLGYAPVASGTFGTLAGIPALLWLDGLREASAFLYLLTFVAVVAASCWVAGRAEGLFGEHDSGKIVIDEVCGYLATMLFVAPTWPNLIFGFFLFRVLDILKPYPASYFDAEVEGGAGVVLDDVVSGLYGCVVMHAMVWLGVLS